MIKYCFTTLAVGEPYESKTTKFYQDLRERTTNCEFFITTTNTEYPDLGDRIHVNVINPPSLHCSLGGFSFHLNLKCLSLKHVLQYQKTNPEFEKFDYVIFTDGDWEMHEDFSEDKILKMLTHMEENDIDFLFERPARIGDGKNDGDNCFFKEKIHDYEILDIDKWDKAHVCNEQFLVFKNNPKFRFFTQRWEQFLWYGIMNDIRSYPDGFDIGVSALEANMKYEFVGVFSNCVPNCFAFYTKSNDYHVRF